MVWFKVDDKLHSHPKAAAASLAALGLWSVAGSWASDHLTDGDVPEHMIKSLSRGSTELADELVSCGLWRRTKSGYRFHQWSADSDGSKRNPSRKEVEQERRKKAEAGRKGGLASGKARSKPQARAKAGASRLVEPPTRPSALTEQRGSEGERPASQGAALASAPATPAPPNGKHPYDRKALLDQLAAGKAKLHAGANRRNGMAELTAAVAELPPLPEPARPTEE